MAEPKRIAVTQIGAAKPKEKVEKKRLNARFTLSLVDSTEKTCPEFSFTELMKNAMGDQEESGDDDDPFASQDRAEHDKLVAIAKSFEEKYALPKMGSKKKKKGGFNRVQEFVDLGDGYDETDPFIDNAEAYDELVPSCLTTQHGGFYINSGKLDFRAVSDSENDFIATPKKKRKKNQITSDQESSDEAPKKRGPKKQLKGDDEIKKRKRKKLSSSELADKPLLKKKKFEKDKLKSLKMKKKANSSTGAELLSVSSTTNGVSSRSPVAKKQDINNMDSVINLVVAQSHVGDSQDGDDSRSSSPTPLSGMMGPGQVSGAPELVPRLPDNLPDNIQILVDKLKKAAQESEEGKCKFFSSKVNGWLLEIENTGRQMKCGWARSIYNHLAAYLPCGKETLIKRAKKLRLEQNDDKLKDPLSRMRDAINRSMPSLLEKHQADLFAVQQQKIDRMQQTGMRDAPSTESDDEGDKADGEKQKRIMAPRRKFEWTNEMRGLLNSVVRIKMEHYELAKVRKQTAEEYLKTFMETELKPLWPQGWMQTRMLFKESQGMHNRWTALGSKPRKPLTLQGSAGSKPSTPISSKPSTPVSAGTSIPLMTTTTVTTTPASTSTVKTSTALIPSVYKDYKQISSSGSSSSDSSYASEMVSPSCTSATTATTVTPTAGHATKTLLDYAGESYNAIAKSKQDASSVNSRPTDLSTKANPAVSVAAKPVELKAAGSLGFSTSSAADICKSATVSLQNISSALSREQMIQGVSVQESSQILGSMGATGVCKGKMGIGLAQNSTLSGVTVVKPSSTTAVIPASTAPKQSASTPKSLNSSQKASSSITPKPGAPKSSGANPAEDSTMTFLEKFCQFAASSKLSLDKEARANVLQQISELAGKVTTMPQTQTVVTKSKQPNTVAKAAPKSVHLSARPIVTTGASLSAAKSSGDAHSQESSVMASKPHLTAALQGKYFSTSQPASAVSTATPKASVTGIVAHKPTSYTAAVSAAKTQDSSSLKPKDNKHSPQAHPSNKQSGVHSQRPAQQVSNMSKETSVAHSHKNKPTESLSQSNLQKQTISSQQQSSVRSKAAVMSAANAVKQALSNSNLQASAGRTSPGQSQVQLQQLSQKVAAAVASHGAGSIASSLLAGLNAPTGSQSLTSSQRTQPDSSLSQKPHTSSSSGGAPKAVRVSQTSQTCRNTTATTAASSTSTKAQAPTNRPPPPKTSAYIPPPKLPASSPSGRYDQVSSTSGQAVASTASQPANNANHRPKHTSAFSPTSLKNKAASNTSSSSLSKPTYPQPASSNNGVSSTTSYEPKFGGLTLSQIQAQTLKASQKAHIQAAQQSVPSGALYRPEAQKASTTSSPYSGLYGSPPSRSSPAVPGYTGLTPPPTTHPPTSPTVHQPHEQGRQGFNLHRSPQAVAHQNNNSLSSIYSSVPVSPNSGLSPYGHPFSDPSQTHHRF